MAASNPWVVFFKSFFPRNTFERRNKKNEENKKRIKKGYFNGAIIPIVSNNRIWQEFNHQ